MERDTPALRGAQTPREVAHRTFDAVEAHIHAPLAAIARPAVIDPGDIPHARFVPHGLGARADVFDALAAAERRLDTGALTLCGFGRHKLRLRGEERVESRANFRNVFFVHWSAAAVEA